MKTIPWLSAAVAGLLFAGCAGIASAPYEEARQALAPTGNLRVGLYSSCYRAYSYSAVRPPLPRSCTAC
ncbi:MAG: amino acid transporter substrate-binding protein family [Herminiimonas sp.]|nr:amino acid transporter substrate-binding protein family [Herminiimonas sp.]